MCFVSFAYAGSPNAVAPAAGRGQLDSGGGQQERGTRVFPRSLTFSLGLSVLTLVGTVIGPWCWYRAAALLGVPR